jgi:murein L,D-transpeptidase YafK
MVDSKIRRFSLVKLPLYFAVGILLLHSFLTADFKSTQLKYKRVRTAYSQKEEFVKERLQAVGIKPESLHIYLRAFKKQRILQVWGKNKTEETYKLIISYPFCMTSGQLGPKRKQGDLQIPEGFYHIDRFNPWSNFFLSLGINYPNRSDRILGNKRDPGGDIFIHGACVTIGCIPITDNKIKELYILAVEARNNGQRRIPVHIFPSKLTAQEMKNLAWMYSKYKKMVNFWTNIKHGYDYFEIHKRLPRITILPGGSYKFQ